MQTTRIRIRFQIRVGKKKTERKSDYSFVELSENMSERNNWVHWVLRASGPDTDSKILYNFLVNAEDAHGRHHTETERLGHAVFISDGGRRKKFFWKQFFDISVTSPESHRRHRLEAEQDVGRYTHCVPFIWFFWIAEEVNEN